MISSSRSVVDHEDFRNCTLIHMILQLYFEIHEKYFILGIIEKCYPLDTTSISISSAPNKMHSHYPSLRNLLED